MGLAEQLVQRAFQVTDEGARAAGIEALLRNGLRVGGRVDHGSECVSEFGSSCGHTVRDAGIEMKVEMSVAHDWFLDWFG